MMPARDLPALAVEDGGPALAQHVAREPDDASRAREAGEHGGLEEPLEVERRVVPLATQPSQHRRQLPPLAGGIDRNPSIDPAHQLHDLAMPGVHEPVDLCRWDPAPQRRHSGHRVHDVSEGTEPDDQNLHDAGGAVSRTRASSSRVEWSFGSPTIAVRPP